MLCTTYEHRIDANLYLTKETTATLVNFFTKLAEISSFRLRVKSTAQITPEVIFLHCLSVKYPIEYQMLLLANTQCIALKEPVYTKDFAWIDVFKMANWQPF